MLVGRAFFFRLAPTSTAFDDLELL